MTDTATAPSTEAAKAAATRLAGMKRPGRGASGHGGGDPGQADVKTGGKKRGKAEGGAAEAPLDEEAAAKKKKQRKIKVIGVVALLLVAGYVAKGKLLKPHYGPGHPAPSGQIFSLGTVTTNLADGHLAQVAVSLQLTAPAQTKTVGKESPEMMATAVADLGQETYAQLLRPAGRTALEHRLLAAYQSELGTVEGAEAVTAVYFTRFVLQ